VNGVCLHLLGHADHLRNAEVGFDGAHALAYLIRLVGLLPVQRCKWDINMRILNNENWLTCGDKSDAQRKRESLRGRTLFVLMRVHANSTDTELRSRAHHADGDLTWSSAHTRELATQPHARSKRYPMRFV
jgi:hypothetical protein